MEGAAFSAMLFSFMGRESRELGWNEEICGIFWGVKNWNHFYEATKQRLYLLQPCDYKIPRLRRSTTPNVPLATVMPRLRRFRWACGICIFHRVRSRIFVGIRGIQLGMNAFYGVPLGFERTDIPR